MIRISERQGENQPRVSGEYGKPLAWPSPSGVESTPRERGIPQVTSYRSRLVGESTPRERGIPSGGVASVVMAAESTPRERGILWLPPAATSFP